MTEIDYIGKKADEYANSPSLILGLDGWILRSIAPELRAQFLNGYLKLLRVSFHPDRYQSESQKNSKQNFLQFCDEVVRAMLADEFSFELMMEDVPTKKNPLVSLKTEIERINGVVETVDEKLQDEIKKSSRATEEVRSLKKQIINLGKKIDSDEAYYFRVRENLRQIVRQNPVPINFRRYHVDGFFVDFNTQPKAVETLSRWSVASKLPTDAVQQIKELIQKDQDSKRLKFKSGFYEGKRLLCGFFACDLAEYLRKVVFKDKKATAEKVASELNRMTYQEPTHETCFDEFEGSATRKYSLPFITEGMLLFIEDCPRLFYVEKVNDGETNLKALITTRQSEYASEISSLRARKNKSEARLLLKISKQKKVIKKLTCKVQKLLLPNKVKTRRD